MHLKLTKLDEVIYLTIGVIICGCNSNGNRFDLQSKVIQDNAILYNNYLSSNIQDARSNLVASAKLVEGAIILEAVGRAELLYKTYLRLYVLEKRDGNEIAAEANLINAKYWMLKSGELIGNAPDKVAGYINQLNPEKIFEDVDSLDRKNNNGKEPEYLLKFHKSSPNPSVVSR